MRKKESGRQIIASIRDGFSHYHIADDCRAVFAARKPDGNILFNGCVIKGCDVVYDVTEQTTLVPGVTECEFRIYGGDGLLVTSPKFAINVIDTVYDDEDEIESTSEFSALTSALTDVNLLIEEVKNLGNDIDPEAIAEAVAEYLDANPIRETDPTVPDWAKQPTKPEYTAAEVGALPDTYTPPAAPVQSVNGKTGTVNLTAGDVGALPDDTQIPTVPDWVKPIAAEIGQYFRISAVDENGNVSAVEAVDAPSGGGALAWDYENTITLEEETATITVNQYEDGTPLALKKVEVVLVGSNKTSAYQSIEITPDYEVEASGGRIFFGGGNYLTAEKWHYLWGIAAISDDGEITGEFAQENNQTQYLNFYNGINAPVNKVKPAVTFSDSDKSVFPRKATKFISVTAHVPAGAFAIGTVLRIRGVRA